LWTSLLATDQRLARELQAPRSLPCAGLTAKLDMQRYREVAERENLNPSVWKPTHVVPPAGVRAGIGGWLFF
jgi:hypothetical protein